MTTTPGILHINAEAKDFEGNNGLGRYVFVPGSDGRAQTISERFDNVTVKKHPRAHNIYFGTYKGIDVAAVSTGMGCPSVDIIMNELFALGVRRFLRIGTTGTLQSRINIGDIVVATSAVRDEHASNAYAPSEVPAVASFPLLQAISQVAEQFKEAVHFGSVHCKASLHGRQLGMSPRQAENQAYMKMLADNGVLSTEMETGLMFILAAYFNQQLQAKNQGNVYAGAVLAVAGAGSNFGNTDPEKVARAEAAAIDLSLQSIQRLATEEKN